jgi:hypothetical protein
MTAIVAAINVVGRRWMPPISVTMRIEPISVLVTPTFAATMSDLFRGLAGRSPAYREPPGWSPRFE